MDLSGFRIEQLPLSWVDEDYMSRTTSELLGELVEAPHKKIGRLRRKDGSTKWLCISSNHIGHTTLSCLTLVDITEYKETQEKTETLKTELQKRESFLHHTLNSLPELVSYIDKNYIYRFVNTSYEKWFSVSRELTVGKSLVDILGDKAFVILKPYVDAALEGKVQKFTRQIPYRGAGERSVEVQYIPDITPTGVEGFYAIIHDVSDLVKIQEEITKKKRDLRRILNALPALIGYWNKDLINLQANDVSSEYFGRTPDEIRGLHIKELLGPELYEKDLPYLRKVLEGEAQTFERDISLPSAEIRHTIAHYLPDYDRGEVVGFFTIVTDVTALKNSEQEKAKLLEKERHARRTAEEATRMRDEMLAVVSHDLRNPLSVVLGTTDLLLRKDALDDAKISQLEKIRRSVKLMLCMIKDLLDVYKFEQGKVDIKAGRSDVDISKMLLG